MIPIAPLVGGTRRTAVIGMTQGGGTEHLTPNQHHSLCPPVARGVETQQDLYVRNYLELIRFSLEFNRILQSCQASKSFLGSLRKSKEVLGGPRRH